MADSAQERNGAVTTVKERVRNGVIEAISTGAGTVIEPKAGLRRMGEAIRGTRPLLLAAVFAAGFVLGRRGRSSG